VQDVLGSVRSVWEMGCLPRSREVSDDWTR
jgi:hypothetical protein